MLFVVKKRFIVQLLVIESSALLELMQNVNSW